jgi:ABC-type glycerol-3-phosphate transport system substrate-binding protein
MRNFRLVLVLSVFTFFVLFPFVSCRNGETVAYEKPKADVVIWHWMTDRQDAFEKLTEQYFEETGVAVSFELYAPSDVYKNKISAASTADILPDVFNPMVSMKELASYVNAGHIENLNVDMEKNGWKDIFFEKALNNNSFGKNNEWGIEAGIYGVPIDVSSLMIYYNKDLFVKAGLDPEVTPKTWEEFIEYGKKLKAAGVQPFVAGFGEGWIINAFAQSYQWEFFGKDGIIQNIQGKISYTDSRWIRIFEMFAEMRRADMLASGIATMINKDAERGFATGRYAMIFNGSWGVNVYFAMNPSLNYGVFSLPVVGDAQYPMKLFGGEGSSFFVNAKSKNKQKAIDFLRWLTSDEPQVFLSKATLNIPSNKNVADGISPILKIFANSIDNTFEQLPVLESWQVLNSMSVNLQSIIIGEKTPEQAVRNLQSEKERQINSKAGK